MDGFDIGRPYGPRLFDAIAQKDQCGPQLYAIGASETTAGAVLDPDMPHVRMIGQRGCDERLRRNAVSAPMGSELEQRGTIERIDVIARGFMAGCSGDWHRIIEPIADRVMAGSLALGVTFRAFEPIDQTELVVAVARISIVLVPPGRMA